MPTLSFTCVLQDGTLSTNAQEKAAVKENLQHWKVELSNNGWEDGNLGAVDGLKCTSPEAWYQLKRSKIWGPDSTSVAINIDKEQGIEPTWITCRFYNVS